MKTFVVSLELTIDAEDKDSAVDKFWEVVNEESSAITLSGGIMITELPEDEEEEYCDDFDHPDIEKLIGEQEYKEER